VCGWYLCLAEGGALEAVAVHDTADDVDLHIHNVQDFKGPIFKLDVKFRFEGSNGRFRPTQSQSQSTRQIQTTW
jgi:hypothetical protein